MELKNKFNIRVNWNFQISAEDGMKTLYYLSKNAWKFADKINIKTEINNHPESKKTVLNTIPWRNKQEKLPYL